MRLTFIAILATAACSLAPEPPWPLPCRFRLEESIDEIARCASRGPGGEITISPAVVTERAAPGTVSEVHVGTTCLFVISSGKTAPALVFAGGADYFVEGLARTKRSGKTGFVNRNLVEVIPPAWDFAFPFKSGLAVVCNGCRTRLHGEHIEKVGGRWGYIDSKGRVVVPLVHSKEGLPPREQVSVP